MSCFSSAVEADQIHIRLDDDPLNRVKHICSELFKEEVSDELFINPHVSKTNFFDLMFYKEINREDFFTFDFGQSIVSQADNFNLRVHYVLNVEKGLCRKHNVKGFTSVIGWS